MLLVINLVGHAVYRTDGPTKWSSLQYFKFDKTVLNRAVSISAFEQYEDVVRYTRDYASCSHCCSGDIVSPQKPGQSTPVVHRMRLTKDSSAKRSEVFVESHEG